MTEQRMLRCVFNHEWQGDIVEINRGKYRGIGKRPFPRDFIEREFTPDRCPTCGHGWSTVLAANQDQGPEGECA